MASRTAARQSLVGLPVCESLHPICQQRLTEARNYRYSCTMPNTKSAERRMRSNERRSLRNRAVKARLRRLQKNYLAAVLKGDRQDATTAFREVASALDKAVKTGVMPRANVNRKKSRLSIRLNQLK